MTDREAQIREMAKKTIVLRLPEMDSVTVRRDETFLVDDEGALLMDVYTPTTANGTLPPVVVIAIGYPDPQGLFRRFGWHVSWARLLAASGVAAVIYGNRQPAADVHAVLKHIRDHAGTLGLDAGRIGLLACSGHGPVALSALMQDAKLACAAFLYAFTMDLNGADRVANAARQYGCVDACIGKSAADLPADVPLLFARAGRDQFAGLNEAMDGVIAAGLERNLPVSIVNHPGGVHAFDLEEDSEASRGIIRQVLSFLRQHLEVR
jgi:acetyl esterase/lipase